MQYSIEYIVLSTTPSTQTFTAINNDYLKYFYQHHHYPLDISITITPRHYSGQLPTAQCLGELLVSGERLQRAQRWLEVLS